MLDIMPKKVSPRPRPRTVQPCICSEIASTPFSLTDIEIRSLAEQCVPSFFRDPTYNCKMVNIFVFKNFSLADESWHYTAVYLHFSNWLSAQKIRSLHLEESFFHLAFSQLV